MKRLSKDERIGATAIAVVALGVCIAAFVVSQCKGGRNGETGEDIRTGIVTTILVADSLSEPKSSVDDSAEKDSGKSRSDSIGVKKKSSGKKKSKKRADKPSKPTQPQRDYLNDL